MHARVLKAEPAERRLQRPHSHQQHSVAHPPPLAPTPPTHTQRINSRSHKCAQVNCIIRQHHYPGPLSVIHPLLQTQKYMHSHPPTPTHPPSRHRASVTTICLVYAPCRSGIAAPKYETKGDRGPKTQPGREGERQRTPRKLYAFCVVHSRFNCLYVRNKYKKTRTQLTSMPPATSPPSSAHTCRVVVLRFVLFAKSQEIRPRRRTPFLMGQLSVCVCAFGGCVCVCARNYHATLVNVCKHLA